MRLVAQARCIVLLLLLWATQSAAQGQPDLDACIQRLDPVTDIGFERIAGKCPDLARQLQRSSWAAWLPRGWNEPGNDLSVGSLRELRELGRQLAKTKTAARTPDPRDLQRVLATLETSSETADGAWTRFKAWLRSLLEPRPESDTDNWLTRRIAQVGLPQSLIEVLTYVALAVVVALAALIVVNELRVAGWLSARARRQRRVGVRDSRARGGSNGDTDRVSPLDRPRILLGLIIARLTETGRLPPAGALTVHELTRVARVDGDEDRARLTDLALASERIRYSQAQIAPEALETTVIQGRELLSHLGTGAA